MQFFESVIQKYTETKIPLKQESLIDKLQQQIDKYLDAFLSEKTQYKYTNLTIDLIQFKEGLLEKIILDIPKQFKQFTIIQQKYLLLFISEGVLQYVIYMHKKRADQFNLFHFILYIYRYIENTRGLDQLLQDSISSFLINSYSQTFKIKDASNFEANQVLEKPFFKNNQNNPIKFQLNQQIQQLKPQLVEVDPKVIREVFAQFLIYQPIFSNITAFLRIMFPDKYYGIYLEQSQIHSKNKIQSEQLKSSFSQKLPIIYINCVDVPLSMCKTHKINGLLVHIGHTNEHLEIISKPRDIQHPLLYDPLAQVCTPIYAFYQQYSYDSGFQEFKLLVSLYVASSIIIQKNRDSYIIQRFYSKRGKSIPNIEHCHEQLKINLIQILKKSTMQELGEKRL